MIKRYISLVFIPILLFALLFAAVAPVRAADPDFSTVNDILQGRRTLFPTDDIIVTQSAFLEPTTTTVVLTDGGTAPIGNEVAYTPSTGFSSFVTATARMYNLPNDVVVTVSANGANLHDQVTGFTQTFTYPAPLSPAQNVYAVTDLTGNGYADIVFLNIGAATTLNAVTAADTGDETKGVFFGNPVSLPSNNGLPFAMAAGDFYGDGHNEIAVAYTAANNINTVYIYVAIYKPIATTDSKGNVTSLTFEPAGSTSNGIPFPPPGQTLNSGLGLTAGTYGGLANAQLVLAYTNINGSQTEVQPITVTPTQVTFNPAQRLTLPQSSINAIFIQSGHLDFFDSSEQVVLETQANGTSTLNVLTLDSSLNVTLASSLTALSNGFTASGIALGNFDQPNTDSNPLALEIAELTSNTIQCTATTYLSEIFIFHVDPANNFALSEGQPTQIGGLNNCYASAYLGVATGDTQGRSLILGTPSKLTVTNHKQPELILGAPPMHVDYVSPGSGAPPEVLNLSAVPGSFYSSYQTEVTGTNQSTRQGTTSYTYGVAASASAGISFGDPLTGSVTAKMSASAGFMNKKFIQKQYSQYSSTGFDASTHTGFGDQVWFKEESHFIYIYPVIGQSACPSASPGCADSEKQPLTIMFSGPSSTTQMSVQGQYVKWYQPVHEVGNLFSYPGSFKQLQDAEGNIALLTSQNPTSFSTDSSSYTATANWSGQSNSSVTSGSTSNITWNTSVSVTESAGIFGGFVGSQKFSYNGSDVQSSLNTQTTKLGQSTGIGIVKPGTFPQNNYVYPVFPYIFGDNPAAGTVQNIDLGTDVQTNGILRAAYTVDPLSSTAGSWWQNTYTAPDVALAHPQRWDIAESRSTGPNCIIEETGSELDCATFNQPQSNIWESEFHFMKGLLITPAPLPSPTPENGQGPQLAELTAGAPIILQARVYNDSMADMPPGSNIFVRFYAQPFNNQTLLQATPANATLIDEVKLDPLPGFLSGQNATSNNYVLANAAQWNPAKFAGQSIAFWVLVYMADSQGNLVPEMPGHGLKSIPPQAVASISDVTPYLETYSNNIGFYPKLYYVNAPGAPATVDPTKAGVYINDVKVSAPRVLLGQTVTISGVVHSTEEVGGFSILYFDGAPKRGGKVFSMDDISHIRADDFQLVKAVYHANSCGEHRLFLKGLEAKFGGEATVRVTMDVNPSLDQLRKMIADLGPRLRKPGDSLLEQLKEAQEAFKKNRQDSGLRELQKFETAVRLLQGKQIPADQANTMLAIIDQIFACMR